MSYCAFIFDSRRLRNYVSCGASYVIAIFDNREMFR